MAFGGGFRGNNSRGGGNRGGGGFRGRRSFDGPREMHKIKCSECGKEAEVPFKPRNDSPVYCRDCYFKKKGITPREAPAAKPQTETESTETEETEEGEAASEEEY